MTPLIRETITWATKAGGDPTKFQWFDISDVMGVQISVHTDVLMTCRPPFERCFVVSRVLSEDVLFIVTGDDPHKGIIVNMWRAPTYAMRSNPLWVKYKIEGDRLRYLPNEGSGSLSEEDARFVFVVLAKWYLSMMATKTAYQPFVRPTFTNQRKIASGKQPSYDWRTVVIDTSVIRCDYKGGTHASPRLHDRRGHSRRLPDGRIVWVRACKVGDAGRGVVFHDYQVKGKNHD